MVACCVNQCGARKGNTHPRLTFHRFPANQSLRKQWLDVIGSETINPRHKNWFVCSLHFEEKCFNRTLDVVRLHDGAVPSSSLLPGRACSSQIVSEEISDTNDTSNWQKPEICLVKTEVDVTFEQDARLATIQKQNKQIEVLTKKCKFLTKKVKSLNEKVRRCNKKIARFSTVIKDLQKRKFARNEETLIFKVYAGSKTLVRRQIAKSKGQP